MERVLEAAGAFAWSISWPQLQVLYLSPSVQSLVGGEPSDAHVGEQITEAIWAQGVRLGGDSSMQELVAELWIRGSTEFEFDATSASGQLSRFHCRAVLIRDATERPLRIDGVAVLSSHLAADEARVPFPSNRLSDIQFVAFRIDGASNIIDWHGTVESATGVSADEAIGVRAEDLFVVDPAVEGGERVRAELRSGEAFMATLRGRSVVLQAVIDRSSGTSPDERLVIATVFRAGALQEADLPQRPAATSRLTAGLAIDPVLDCIREHVLVLDAESCAVVTVSRGVEEELGYLRKDLPVHDLSVISPYLAEVIASQMDYLEEGCLVATRAAVWRKDGTSYEAEARIRYWHGADCARLIVNVWPVEEFDAAGTATGSSVAGAVGTLLIDAMGTCQVLSFVDAAWERRLVDAFDGVNVVDLPATPTLSGLMHDMPAKVELRVDDECLECVFDLIRNDQGAVAGYLGALVVGSPREE